MMWNVNQEGEDQRSSCPTGAIEIGLWIQWNAPEVGLKQ